MAVFLETCRRSGQLPEECGLYECDNGCATQVREYIPLEEHERVRARLDLIETYQPESDIEQVKARMLSLENHYRKYATAMYAAWQVEQENKKLNPARP